MPAGGSFAYVQARLQAQHGRRLDQTAWRRLDGTVDMGGFLHLARSTSLGPWVESLRGTYQADTVERGLRQVWLLQITRVARWSPLPWQDAVHWLATLPALPILHHLQSGNIPPPWVQADDTLAWTLGDPQRAPPPPLKNLPLETLQHNPSGRPLLELWHETWGALWPKLTRANAQHLGQLTELTIRHWQRIADLDAAATSAAALERLEHDLVRLFRRGAQSPLALFCSLGLLALDLRRLRGGLVTRALLPNHREFQAWR